MKRVVCVLLFTMVLGCKEHKHCEWYDLHKHEGIDSGFVGYWAFEVAAIVKIKELDDSNFRDNVFYPDRLLNEN